jgi:hypothetical protein
VTAADYRLTFPGAAGSENYLQKILDSPEIIVMKKSKSGEKEADIRPDILGLDCDPAGAVTMRLSAGSARNLKPMQAAQKIFADMGISPALHEIAIVRQELYGYAANQLAPLHEIAIDGKISGHGG